ncbi:MAG: DUF3237 domain-containing protein [Roseiarcus sp.]
MSAPRLLHIADLSVEVAEPIVVGETPEGLRRIIPIRGGSVSGPRLEGEILGVGADFQMFRSDGVTILEARYVLRTSDGAVIAVNKVGLRRGPPDAMARLARGEVVDPAQIYFRTAFRFETARESYRWLMRSLFIGSGARHPDRVEIGVFEVA